jgi:uncharacterized repeat protein (TIGR03803 family)
MLIVLLGLLTITIVSPAQKSITFVTLDNIGGVNFSLQGIDGNFYGISGGGAIVRMTPTGLLTTLYNFCSEANCADGSGPGPLIQGLNSSLYGITTAGGAYGYGTVFEFTAAGKFKTLHSFCDPNTCDDGYGANVLVLAANRNIYGLTTAAASGCVWPNEGGALFEVTPNDKFSVVAPVCYQDAEPPTLFAQGVNGALFASTWSFLIEHSYASSGGFYALNPQGAVVGGGEFCVDKKCDVSVHPVSAVEAPNGDFWGTWQSGQTLGGIYKFKEAEGFRPAFRITSNIVLTVFGSDGSVYGGDGGGTGSLIKFTPPKNVQIIHFFSPGKGGTPSVQHTNGDFYGSTGSAIFRLSTGLPPFLQTLPSAGKAGSVVFIKGTEISEATAATFNGISASFVKASPSALKAIVPQGVLGPVKVEVTLPGGHLLQGNFRILQ